MSPPVVLITGALTGIGRATARWARKPSSFVPTRESFVNRGPESCTGCIGIHG
jgi:hypothetical protein